jgi:putative ABC transport system ATP-binding protein
MNEKKLAKFRQRNIGFVFQSYNLLSTLTALENVKLPLKNNKIPKKVRNKRAYLILKSVGLEKRWRHKPSQMSGGQQQRVSIARAFVNNPAVVFADEPTGNLDTKTSEEMMGLMLKMAKENQQTLIIVSHDNDTVKYAKKIIRIRDGKIDSIEINENALSANEEKTEQGADLNNPDTIN